MVYVNFQFTDYNRSGNVQSNTDKMRFYLLLQILPNECFSELQSVITIVWVHTN